MPAQEPTRFGAFGSGKSGQGSLPPPLIKGRYGEPIITRMYNNTPKDRVVNGVEQNGGFGRNETQLHFHNAHNGAESDGATGAHHFPGTFYDYLWGTSLARRDQINTGATDDRAAGPDDNGGDRQGAWRLARDPGHHVGPRPPLLLHRRECLQGQSRQVNYYSGRDRGHEGIDACGGNLRLPSGKRWQGWGNVDFDVNLTVSDGATDQEGQYLLRHLHQRRLPRRPAARELRLCALLRCAAEEVSVPHAQRVHVALLQARAELQRAPVPFKFIANDGNFVVNPIHA